MKLPWISRAAYDTLVNELAASHEAVECERQRFARLVEQMLQMRRTGFEPAPPETAAEIETPLPAEVEAAIAERAFDPVTQRRLRQYARQQLTDGEPAAVAALILAGEEIEE